MTEFETRIKNTIRLILAMIGIMSFFVLLRAFDMLTIKQKFNGMQEIPFDWTGLIYFGISGFVIIYLLINLAKMTSLQSQVTWRDK